MTDLGIDAVLAAWKAGAGEAEPAQAVEETPTVHWMHRLVLRLDTPAIVTPGTSIVAAAGLAHLGRVVA